MKGKDIIKAIIDANGLDNDYEFDLSTTSNTKKYNSIDELLTFDIDADNGEVIMYVADPIQARKYGLSDSYKMYIWDGSSMYFFKEQSGPHDWSISYGGGSTTIVSESVIKYRDTAAKKMVEAVAKSNGKIPSWMEWRVKHYNNGLPGLSVFED